MFLKASSVNSLYLRSLAECLQTDSSLPPNLSLPHPPNQMIVMLCIYFCVAGRRDWWQHPDQSDGQPQRGGPAGRQRRVQEDVCRFSAQHDQGEHWTPTKPAVDVDQAKLEKNIYIASQ